MLVIYQVVVFVVVVAVVVYLLMMFLTKTYLLYRPRLCLIRPINPTVSQYQC
jgi:hypothetical protein